MFYKCPGLLTSFKCLFLAISLKSNQSMRRSFHSSPHRGREINSFQSSRKKQMSQNKAIYIQYSILSSRKHCKKRHTKTNNNNKKRRGKKSTFHFCICTRSMETTSPAVRSGSDSSRVARGVTGKKGGGWELIVH